MKSILYSKNCFDKNLTVIVQKRSLKDAFPVHCHDFYEIEWIIDGCGMQILNGNRYPLQKGNLYLLRPTDFHTVIPNGTLQLYNIAFDGTLLSDEIEDFPVNDGDNFAFLNGELYEIVKSTVASLCYECEAERPHSVLIQQNLLEYLTVLILRAREHKSVPQRGEKIRTALSLIRQNYSDITPTDVAAAVGYNRSYFSYWFRDTIGITFTEYVNALRLSEGKRLLLSTDKTATEIGFSIGFSSFSGFLKEFKKKYGITPTEFRKSSRTET